MRAWPHRWKLWVQVGLGILLTMDAGLAVVRWRMSVTASREELQTRAVRLRAENAALRLNIQKAEQVRRDLPQIAKQCEVFYNEQIFGSGGYASLIPDLDAIAKEAGLRMENERFSQKEKSAHGVIEVDITGAVEGNYDALIRFIDGLERSNDFFVLDTLDLASSTGGLVRLNFGLHTYLGT